jgi:periodic tryptophan protein 2
MTDFGPVDDPSNSGDKTRYNAIRLTVSGEKLHVYSLGADMLFDPIPGAFESKLASGYYTRALRMEVHLNEFALVRQVLAEILYVSLTHVVRSIGPEHLIRLVNHLD